MLMLGRIAHIVAKGHCLPPFRIADWQGYSSLWVLSYPQPIGVEAVDLYRRVLSRWGDQKGLYIGLRQRLEGQWIGVTGTADQKETGGCDTACESV